MAMSKSDENALVSSPLASTTITATAPDSESWMLTMLAMTSGRRTVLHS